MEYISEIDREMLEKFFEEGASRVETKPEHWIYGSDAGESFCLECCKEEVKRLLMKNPDEEYEVDGGFEIESDSTAYCVKCGQTLENTLTDNACENEVEHFLDNGFDVKSDDDCRAMSEVISAHGWEPYHEQTFKDENEKKNALNYYEDLHKLCRLILRLIRGENET